MLGFERREDAEQFLEQLQERLAKFGLELHPEKTRLIEFGRFAAERRKRRGEGKPERSSRQGWGTCRVKSLCCQLPVFRQLAYSVRAEVTKHVLPGCKSH